MASSIQNFTITKFSKFESENWYHYPQRSNLSITFNDKKENDEIQVVIQYKGSNLKEIILFNNNTEKVVTSLLAKSPCIGIKQKNKQNGNLLSRFQISLIDDNEFRNCLLYLKSCKFNENGYKSNDETCSELSIVTNMTDQKSTQSQIRNNKNSTSQIDLDSVATKRSWSLSNGKSQLLEQPTKIPNLQQPNVSQPILQQQNVSQPILQPQILYQFIPQYMNHFTPPFQQNTISETTSESRRPAKTAKSNPTF
ncbi:uncharacterized protein KGF55_000494 [Candida pseudojiufengensis]|uniref:uncharacterized protein n=1 Tax=Candida pseudojiufengensis TaxID=497109 RepID=UPI0022252EC5|nr:uncharacterized protein KGF55_000494 [Candida pseudojiufengensis]KAI5966185.1 hypothetical protein KGF55_000494 [Candida pseudojiufengensis]